jgi:hypothetical protein
MVPVKRLWIAVKPASNGEPVPALPQALGRTEQEQLWLDARTGTEECVRLGGRNELATKVSCAPPAARQFGCLWRKRNLTQSPCPTTSRRYVIPGRNNRRIVCRDQVDRSARHDTSCKDFSSEGDWLTNATRIPLHAESLIRTADGVVVASASSFFFQIGVQVPANEADECVMVYLTQSSETGAPHLRSDLFNEM